MRTREQEYAEAVFKCITKRNVPDKKARDAYGSMAHKLPVLIRTAGLAQALAFVEARHKEHSPPRLLLADLIDVLEKPDLVERSRTASLPEYMRLTQDSLAALLWFKRYAQSVLDVDAATAATLGEEAPIETEAAHV